MNRTTRLVAVTLWKIALSATFAVGVSHAQQPVDLDNLRQKPIAMGNGKVGELLRQWWLKGTAAGNAGDFYDNRDGDHSPLNMTSYPQLSAIKYSPDDIALRKHWAAQRVLVPHVTFGNSSTSAPAHLGGSNPRSAYTSPGGLLFLYDQYTRNNLYIYPEHRDHDPGHNGLPLPSPFGSGVGGEGGYGDLYPTNTPYLIISQGSSGSDQPFMRMLPSVLAAFRPEVKAKLTETGFLMPTIQMLFRSTNKHLKDPKEYLTAKAHPSVFEGAWVDELALVQKAHALELKSLPPLAQLRVLEEDKGVNGIDYFEIVNSEVLAHTPACIARIHRSKAHKQRIVVSAEASHDLNKSKLTYTWVVFRGDPGKIKIVPKKDDHSVVEITVAHHERRPIAPGSALESNRVEIGVFVHNGTHYSAPGFVTFHSLDREARVYNRDGKILSIAHGMGEAELRVTNWEKLFSQLAKDDATAQLLGVNKEQQRVFAAAAAFHQDVNQEIHKAQEGIKLLEKAMKDVQDENQKQKLKKLVDYGRLLIGKSQKIAETALDLKEEALADTPRHFVHARLAKLTQDPLFTQTHTNWLKDRRAPANEPRIKVAFQKLYNFGICNGVEILTPLLPGKTLADSTWTPFEKAHLAWLHDTLLAELAFPGMTQVVWHGNYVDHRLSVPREWRDLMRHDPNGVPIGWMRYSAAGVQIFNQEGLLAIERDLRGRVVRGRTVRYVQDPPKAKGINTNPLRMVLGDTIVIYEFADANDWLGRRAGTEAVRDEKK